MIENAIKYTKAGEVRIDITGDAEHARVSVHDSGIGIPAEDIPHLFQKFYRVDNTDTREIGGTGLGLFLSRQLVESMGGHMSVESVYGKGSTFTVELNRLNQEEIDRKMNAVAHTEAIIQPAQPTNMPQNTPPASVAPTQTPIASTPTATPTPPRDPQSPTSPMT